MKVQLPFGFLPHSSFYAGLTCTGIRLIGLYKAKKRMTQNLFHWFIKRMIAGIQIISVNKKTKRMTAGIQIIGLYKTTRRITRNLVHWPIK